MKILIEALSVGVLTVIVGSLVSYMLSKLKGNACRKK